MNDTSFLFGIFLINQLILLAVSIETRKLMHELNSSIQRLCAYLSAK